MGVAGLETSGEKGSYVSHGQRSLGEKFNGIWSFSTSIEHTGHEEIVTITHVFLNIGHVRHKLA